MATNETVVGASENVDVGEATDETKLYAEDVDDHRVLAAYCCTCEENATLYLEPGRSRPWEHETLNPAHVVDYWRVDDGDE